MPQRRLLLDSNAYFRLARSIRPLLGVEFGPEECCLYVLEQLENEFRKSSRLRSKFHWVNDPEYVENRRTPLNLGRTEQHDTTLAVGFIKNHVRLRALGLSQVDIFALAAGSAAKITVVTDDEDMHDVAEVFGIGVMKSLQLLKLMLDAGHIDMAKVREVVAYWTYELDKPADCDADYRRLFGEPFPTPRR